MREQPTDIHTDIQTYIHTYRQTDGTKLLYRCFFSISLLVSENKRNELKLSWAVAKKDYSINATLCMFNLFLIEIENLTLAFNIEGDLTQNPEKILRTNDSIAFFFFLKVPFDSFID